MEAWTVTDDGGVRLDPTQRPPRLAAALLSSKLEELKGSGSWGKLEALLLLTGARRAAREAYGDAAAPVFRAVKEATWPPAPDGGIDRAREFWAAQADVRRGADALAGARGADDVAVALRGLLSGLYAAEAAVSRGVD